MRLNNIKYVTHTNYYQIEHFYGWIWFSYSDLDGKYYHYVHDDKYEGISIKFTVLNDIKI